MNTKRRPTSQEPTVREALAALGIESSHLRSKRLARERMGRQLAMLHQSHREAESLISGAMATSSIPGIEVRHID